MILSKSGKRKYIDSYGIILFYFCTSDSAPKFLLIQRRDTYEYVDIVRGNWHGEERLKSLCMGLSKEEKERLKTHTFDEIWGDLWVVHGRGIHKDGYDKAKKKYDQHKDKIDRFISSSSDEDCSLPWGFPKGRKNGANELERVCALREFEEETKIKSSNIRLCHKTAPLSEFYKGKDGKKYCTYYFLAETNRLHMEDHIQTPGTIRRTSASEEVAEVRWMTFDEAAEVLVLRRRNILKNVADLINSSYKEISPFYFKDKNTERG